MDEPPDEASAHAVNAEPWKPLPGMVKRQCLDCHYWFATWPRNKDERCPFVQAQGCVV
jgi:hypothetical protein